MRGYEASVLPFTDEELYQGYLLQDAGRRAPAGCQRCLATGELDSGESCPDCEGRGVVMIER